MENLIFSLNWHDADLSDDGIGNFLQKNRNPEGKYD